MDVRRLLQFRTVVEAGSLTRAAAILHLTPGTVSKAIRQLEHDSGFALFARAGRGLELTAEGRRLYVKSDRLAHEYHRFMRSLTDASGPAEAIVRLVSIEPFTTHAFVPVAETLDVQTGIRVLDRAVGRIEESVLADEADLGVTYVPYPHADLHFEKIGASRFRIFGRSDVFGGIDFADLPFASPLAPVERGALPLFGVDAWPYERVPRRVKYQLTSLETALALARHGHCVVFLPSFVAYWHNRNAAPELALSALPGPAELGVVEPAVHLVVRRDRRQEGMVGRMATTLASVIAVGA